MKNPLQEGIKEYLRVTVLAVLPVLIDSLANDELSIRGIVLAVVLAALRGIDAYIHENKNIKANGLLPF